MMPEEKNSGKEYIASGSISGKTVPAAKKKHLHPAAVFFLKLGIILAAFYLVFHFVFGIYRISGNYMFPKVNDGDLIITYRLGDLHKNDVVMYRTPDGIRAGRVIGLPGTSIDITDQGAVYSDGSQLEEEIFYPTVKADGSDVTWPLTAGDDEYVILNDFRSDTKDSRTYGVIRADEIEGDTIFVLRRRGF